VDAHLVCSPRLQPHAQQGVLGEHLDDLEVRHRLTRRIRIERAAHRVVAGRGPIGASIRPRSGARPAADEREVLPLERVLAHQRLQTRVGLLRLRDDEQS